MIYILNIDSQLYADRIYLMNLFVRLWILSIEEGFGDTLWFLIFFGMTSFFLQIP